VGLIPVRRENFALVFFWPKASSNIFLVFSVNRDISEWNISSMTQMQSVFQDAAVFNQNLCSWGWQVPASGVDFSRIFLRSGCLSTVIQPDRTNVPAGP
jgi:hypothetical protein